MLPALITDYAPMLRDVWQETSHKLQASFSKKNTLSSDFSAVLHAYLQHPGKLVRPSLFLFAYEKLGEQKITPSIIRLAVSLELLHTYLLIHDDIMDKGETRRGGPSLHKCFAARHQEQKLPGNSDEYGINMAILAGDILCLEADKCWTEAEIASITTPQHRQLFDDLKDEVYWGQHLDLALPTQPTMPSQEDIINLAIEKTGKYSIYKPLQLGWRCATGFSATEPEWIATYSINIGIAFQIIDDILGTFGQANITGKSTTSDIQEKKLTHLVYFAYQRASSEDQKVLHNHYNSQSNIPEESIRNILVKNNAEPQARTLAKHHYQLALESLNSDMPPEIATQLTNLAQFIINRDK